MRPRFRPREALFLYLVLLACVAVLFLVGLELGRDNMLAGNREPDEAEAAQVSDRAAATGSGPVEVFDNLSPSSEPTRSAPIEPTSSTSSDDSAVAASSDEGRSDTPSGKTPTQEEPDRVAAEPAAKEKVETRSEGTDAEPEATPAPAETAESGKNATQYTIQVAAHSSEQEARQTLLRLQAKGFDARIQPPTAALGDRYYRVWVGTFDSQEEARAKESELKSAGFLTYIRKTR